MKSRCPLPPGVSEFDGVPFFSSTPGPTTIYEASVNPPLTLASLNDIVESMTSDLASHPGSPPLLYTSPVQLKAWKEYLERLDWYNSLPRWRQYIDDLWTGAKELRRRIIFGLRYPGDLVELDATKWCEADEYE